MKVPADSVQSVSPKVLENFVQSFPHDHFKLDMDKPESKDSESTNEKDEDGKQEN